MVTKKKIIFGVVLVLVIVVGGFTIWAYTPPAPMQEAIDALRPDDQIEVINEKWIEFRPKSPTSELGFIIYPGGRVDPRSYAPLAREIAKSGFLVIIAKIPFNLAVFAPNVATPIIDAHKEINKWVIGGHSLGGAFGSSYAYDNTLAGIVLWASFPAKNISDFQGKVISIYGSEDGLLSQEELEKSKTTLPASTIWVEIQGGNHAYFGYYGEQSGDKPAKITREQQQALIANATISFLQTM